ncbi:MAG: polysaccharide pyruvyl transferase family protein [Acutalibacteraceae bacterium]|jgi:hypothetical protein|nr:polysaccharide pyruvyl transferase family protein [Acutalibacteraceae bacterium]
MYKKLGIVTFHHALSYGAVLQTYALQNFLNDMGVENEVINYRCKFIEDRAKIVKYIKGKSLKNYCYTLRYAKHITKERKNSQYFGEHFLKMTKPYTKETIKECAGEFDGFITGSDQVWSPVCAGFDSAYFLDFADDSQKYSYAASFGTKQLPAEKQQQYKERIGCFSAVSVREASGKELVKDVAGKDAVINVDPTLLLNSKKWDEIAAEVDINEPYIFVFTVLNPKNLVNYALELARKTGMKVIYLNKAHKVKDPMLTYMDAVTADKFLGLIKNAAYVCTNSFHGNAFSLIYHKNFVVETDTQTGENNRSKELMIKLGLENRILAEGYNPQIDADTDWSAVESFLTEEQNKSREYLLSISKK